ncbi:MAG TPA: glycosyltransferase family 39 protein [Vicinamibacterales bacterium]|jgi:uncharacterized membrane protein|nr:glycosyltransferase family 39 protein [Vicinamibacterales bacterium]
MPPTPTFPLTRVLLVLVLSVGAAASLTGLDWGLPYQWHTDEKVTQALNVLHSSKRDPDYFINPHLHIYLVAAAFEIAHRRYPAAHVGRALPEILPMLDADSTGRALQFTAMRLARGISVLFGLSTLYVLFVIGRRSWDDATGLLAAAFAAVTMGLVNLWHFATPEALLILLTLLALGSLDRLMAQATYRSYAVTGLLVGLACSTKYTACLLAVPVLAAHAAVRGRSSLDARSVRHLATAAAASLAGFLAGTPLVIVDWKQFWQFGVEYNWYTGAPTGTLIEVRHSYGPYLALLADGLGWPLLVLSGIGLAAAIRRLIRDRLDASRRSLLIHVIWIVSFYGFYGLSPHHALRFIMPIAPSLVLLAAVCSVAAGRVRRVPVRRVVVLSIALVLVYSAIYTGRADDMFLNDTRYAAGRYLTDALTPGGRLDFFEIEAYLPYFNRPCPGLRFVPFVDHVTLHGARFWETADDYLRDSNAPIVDSDFYWDRYLDNPRGYPERAEFYRFLLTGTDPNGFHPIARFAFANPRWLNPRPERVAPDVVVFGKSPLTGGRDDASGHRRASN